MDGHVGGMGGVFERAPGVEQAAWTIRRPRQIRERRRELTGYHWRHGSRPHPLERPNVGANEQHDLRSLRHRPQGVRQARHGLERAKTAQALAVLVVLGIDNLLREASRRLARRCRGERAVDGRAQPGAIAGEVLRRSGRRGRLGEDDRRLVCRPQMVDRGLRDAARQGLVVRPDRPVERDHHQSARVAVIVAGDVARRVTDPGREGGIGRPRRGQLDRRERHDRPLVPALEHGEILGRQPAHRMSMLIQHGHVEPDDVDIGSEGRNGRRGRRRPRRLLPGGRPATPDRRRGLGGHHSRHAQQDDHAPASHQEPSLGTTTQARPRIVAFGASTFTFNSCVLPSRSRSATSTPSR